MSSVRSSDPDSGPQRLLSPLPTTVRAWRLYREKTAALSSLVDSRLIMPTSILYPHAAKALSVIGLFFNSAQKKSESHHGWCDSNPGTKILFINIHINSKAIINKYYSGGP